MPPVHPTRVCFAMPAGKRRDMLWCEHAQAEADRLGFDVDLPPADLDPADQAGWAELIAGYPALLTGWGTPTLDEAVLAKADGLKVLGHAAGSVAPIVSQALYDRGVRVVTANRVMARSVAEWGLMMTMIALRRLPAYAQWAGATPMRWDRRALVLDASPHDKTVGIWGYGEVARQLIDLLQPLGFQRIVVHSTHLSAQKIDDPRVQAVGWEQLLESSDMLHLCESLTDQSRGALGARQLAMLGQGATLINAGRGRLVDEQALVKALKSGRIRAILDVFHHEPLPEDSPLRSLDNVVLTPHCAGRGRTDLYVATVLEDFTRFFQGQPMEHEVSAQRALMMTQKS